MCSSPIAIFIPSLEGGGAEKMMVRLANELSDRNFNVIIIVGTKKGPYLKLVCKNIRIYELQGWKMLSFLKLMYQIKPTVLISALFKCNIMSIFAKLISFNKVKVIITERNYKGLGNKVKKYKYFIIESLKRILYGFADKAVGISEGVTEVLRSEYRIQSSKTVTIHNPAYSNEIIELSYEKIDDSWFLDSNSKTIICVGRLVPVKDHKTLLNAFKRLRQNNNNVKLVILGEGPEKPYIESFIKENGFETAIKLYGFVDNPYKYIKNSDVLVLSSLSEGFGNVLVESLALGTPVVSTDCPTGPRDILGDNEYGILVPTQDSYSLSNAINKILLGDIVFKEETLKQRGREFSVKTIADKYEKVIFSIIK